jgi:hypothetical protein
VRAIRKRIVTDQEMRPVTVQIYYEDWLEIERLLQRRPGGKAGEQQDDFEELLEKTSGLWRGGDGLEYQRKLREEWEDRW